MTQIRKFFIDNLYLFSLIGDNLSYVDLNIDAEVDESGWKDVNISFPHGRIVKLLTCRSRLYNKICGAVVEFSKPIDTSSLKTIYGEIVQAIRSTKG
ncbi:MAG: hypothetical protein NO114_04785 [Sulfolobales archaeon]|nr:hypothetical protein [Sulfolobales archaeon]